MIEFFAAACSPLPHDPAAVEAAADAPVACGRCCPRRRRASAVCVMFFATCHMMLLWLWLWFLVPPAACRSLPRDAAEDAVVSGAAAGATGSAAGVAAGVAAAVASDMHASLGDSCYCCYCSYHGHRCYRCTWQPSSGVFCGQRGPHECADDRLCTAPAHTWFRKTSARLLHIIVISFTVHM